jgi:hypothetical protein
MDALNMPRPRRQRPAYAGADARPVRRHDDRLGTATEQLASAIRRIGKRLGRIPQRVTPTVAMAKPKPGGSPLDPMNRSWMERVATQHFSSKISKPVERGTYVFKVKSLDPDDLQ